MKMLAAFALMIPFLISCQTKNLQEEVARLKTDLSHCEETINDQEYILQTTSIRPNIAMTVVTLGAFHGHYALKECEAEALEAAQKTKLRWWCVKGK